MPAAFTAVVAWLILFVLACFACGRAIQIKRQQMRLENCQADAVVERLPVEKNNTEIAETWKSLELPQRSDTVNSTVCQTTSPTTAKLPLSLSAAAAAGLPISQELIEEALKPRILPIPPPPPQIQLLAHQLVPHDIAFGQSAAMPPSYASRDLVLPSLHSAYTRQVPIPATGRNITINGHMWRAADKRNSWRRNQWVIDVT